MLRRFVNYVFEFFIFILLFLAVFFKFVFFSRREVRLKNMGGEPLRLSMF